jgi:hypothetical protein
VRNAGGKVTNWALELGSPLVLEKNFHWSGTVLETGTKVSVDGWLANNGQNLSERQKRDIARRSGAFRGLGIF